jgi:penicillin-binding protein 2
VSERSNLRLIVLGILIFSLFATLISRLFYLQVMEGDEYRAAAANNAVREVVEPAVRGLILDQAGRPLVSNRTSIVVTINRQELNQESEKKGNEVITRLAEILGATPESISERLLPCGTEGAPKPPICWNGSTYQAVPVASDVDPQTALTIMEKRSEFAGVTAKLTAVREYGGPFEVNAAHILGYLGPVTEEQIAEQGQLDAYDRLRRTDTIGRSGLESYYDTQLRGKPSVTTLEVDTLGQVTATIDQKPAVSGDYLVSTIDAKLQSVVEEQLVAAVQRAQGQGYPGDSGAAVVVDVRNGQVLAMASYPTYDPGIWVGGVSQKQYKSLVKSDSLSSNATQGLFAPGSTYKVVSTAAAGKEGYSLYSDYQCPKKLTLGTQTFRNYESAAYGRISLAKALEVSCNTVFYGLADQMWEAAGGNEATRDSADPIADTASMFGFGSPTGIDLPGDSAGRVAGRAFKVQNWEAKRDTWCANAITGYPETRKTDPKLADYFTALDRENCADGFRWREGDALNAAIGQGDTTVTPLQMAMAYAAIANGGTVYEPKLVKAIIGADGTVIERIAPTVKSKLELPKSTINFLQRSLPGVTTNGSGETPFIGFPLNQIPVASKTGSAQVTGDKVSTSWFASYAPANKPRYAIVMMVTQGGTGSKTSGPSVRKIYEALFGVDGTSVNPNKSVFIGGAPSKELPVIRPDGTPVTPKGKMSGMVTATGSN